MKIAASVRAKCPRTSFWKRFIAFGICAASFNLSAQQPSGDFVKGAVTTDGGSVYEKPDFDAPVIDYLAFKTPLQVSRQATPGEGGLGLFHRVHYQNKTGYMADTDIRILGGKGGDAPVAGDKTAGEAHKGKKKSDSKAWGDDEAKNKTPLLFRRYIGLALADIANYTEQYGGRNLSSSMLFYGLRASGPKVLFDIPMDVNVWFTLQKPAYFSQFDSATPSGFVVMGDFDLLLPLAEWKTTMINCGVGPMWVYSSYRIQVKHSQFDSQEVRLGLDLDLGITHRIGNWALKLDGRYFLEKAQYFGALASVQMEY